MFFLFRALIFVFIIIATLSSLTVANTEDPTLPIVQKDLHQALKENELEVLDKYRLDVAIHINKVWTSRSQILENPKYNTKRDASIVFRILPSGEIVYIQFLNRSGVPKFDIYAYMAIKEASPVKPHPEGVSKRFIEMGLNFNNKGVK